MRATNYYMDEGIGPNDAEEALENSSKGINPWFPYRCTC